MKQFYLFLLFVNGIFASAVRYHGNRRYWITVDDNGKTYIALHVLDIPVNIIFPMVKTFDQIASDMKLYVYYPTGNGKCQDTNIFKFKRVFYGDKTYIRGEVMVESINCDQLALQVAPLENVDGCEIAGIVLWNLDGSNGTEFLVDRSKIIKDTNGTTIENSLILVTTSKSVETAGLQWYWYLIIGILAVGILAGIIICIFCIRRRRQNAKKSKIPGESVEDEEVGRRTITIKTAVSPEKTSKEMKPLKIFVADKTEKIKEKLATKEMSKENDKLSNSNDEWKNSPVACNKNWQSFVCRVKKTPVNFHQFLCNYGENGASVPENLNDVNNILVIRGEWERDHLRVCFRGCVLSDENLHFYYLELETPLQNSLSLSK